MAQSFFGNRPSSEMRCFSQFLIWNFCNLFSASSRRNMVLTSSEHDQADESNLAVRLEKHLGIERTLFLLIDDHEIQTVLERFQCSRHSFVGIDFLSEIAAARFDLSLGRAFLNLLFGQRPEQLALLLAFLECLDLDA